MHDMVRINGWLNYLQRLRKEDFDQGNGSLVADEYGSPDRECGVCVGAHAAMFLETKPSYMNGVFWWDFQNGRYELAKLYQVKRRDMSIRIWELSGLNIRRGTFIDPFGADPWCKHPYYVFREYTEELTGYCHGVDPEPELVELETTVLAELEEASV